MLYIPSKRIQKKENVDLTTFRIQQNSIVLYFLKISLWTSRVIVEYHIKYFLPS